MHSYADFISEIASLIRDDAAKLTTTSPGGDIDLALQKALREYSVHKPHTVRMKIQGTSAQDYNLETIFGSLWVHGTSSIREIEYPFGEIPKEIVDEDSWEIYDDGSAQDGSNLVLRFIDAKPASTEYFVAEFNTDRVLTYDGEMNFPDTNENFSNITTLAAVFCCQRLAAAYAQSIDATINADVVNYSDKSSKYMALAKQYQRQYNVSVFGQEDPKLSLQGALREVNVKPRTNDDRPTLFHR